MKPIRLSIKGLNSFIEEQVIDFATLTQYGLFGVFGPTGSGKSTILDGITIALYGHTSRNSSNYINTQCDKMQVVFDFEIKEVLYQVTRTYKRTANSINAVMPTRLVNVSDDHSILAEKTTSVNNLCYDIIGLKFEDFIRTVVLPQGKFSEFMKLKNKDRRDMLERLFSLNKYGDDLSIKLSSVNKKEHEKMAVLSGKLEMYEEVNPEAYTALEQVYKEVEQQLQVAVLEEQNCNKTYQALLNKYEQYVKYMALKEEHKIHLTLKSDIENQEKTLKNDQRLIQIKPYYITYLQQKSQGESLNQEQSSKSTDQQFMSRLVGELKEKVTSKTQTYQQLQIDHQVKYHQISEGKTVLSQVETLTSDSNTLKLNITNHQQTFEKNKKVIDDSQIAIESLNTKLVTLDDVLKTQVSSEYKKKIQDGLFLEQEVSYLKKDILKREEVITQTQNKKETFEKQLKELHTSLTQVNLELKNLACSPLDAEQFKTKQTELLNEKQNLLLLKATQDQELQKLEDLKNTVEPLKAALIKQDVLYLEYVKQEENRMVTALQEKLVSNTPCLVCGSLEHHPVAVVSEVVDFDINHYQTIKFEVDKTLLEIETLTSKEQKQVTQELITLDQQLEQLQKDYDASTQSTLLEGQVKQIKERIVEIETLNQESSQTLTDEKEKLIPTVNAYEEKIKQLSKIKEDYDVDDFKKAQNVIEANEKSIEEATQQKEALTLQLKTSNNTLNDTQKDQIKTEHDLTSFKNSFENNQLQIETYEDKLSHWFGENRDLEGLENVLKEKEAESEQQLEKLNKEFLSQQDSLQDLQKRLDEIAVLLIETKKNLLENEKKYTEKLAQYHLSIEELIQFEKKEEDLISIEAAIKDYFVKLDTMVLRLKEYHEILGDVLMNDEMLQKEKEIKESATAQKNSLQKQFITIEKDMNILREKLNLLKDLLEEKKVLDHQLSLIADLVSLFKGKRFVEFIAMFQLRFIATDASTRLLDITSGKYGLELDDQGLFVVRDYSYGGVLRDTSTLSGGESFIVSLALALALSSQIQLKGTAPLELFFLDEGFGTLDEQFLEVVMNSLERVHHKYLSIGLISHVESIKNRVPIKLNIIPSVSGESGSRVKVEHS